MIDFLTFIYFFTAQLLCKNYYYWWAEEDRHLLQAAHCLRWRNHLRLQISHWRWENFVSVWFQKLQKISQLETNFVSRFLFVSPSFGQQDLWFKKVSFFFDVRSVIAKIPLSCCICTLIYYIYYGFNSAVSMNQIWQINDLKL